MPFVTLAPNFSLHYLDIHPAGSPAVVLLHGLGATGDSWALQFGPLQLAGFRILAPDGRGFGRSGWPAGRQTVADMAGDIASLLNSLSVSPAHIVGISMGGTLALQLALDHPELVDKLVLVNTFARLQPASPGGWLYFAWRYLLLHTLGLEVQARAVAGRLFPRPEQADLRQGLIEQILQANPHGYRAAMRALGRYNALSHLAQLTQPTLIITGELDTTVPLPNQRLLADRIPGARQVIIPGAGHAVSVESPDAFNAALLAFLRS
jgi:3-oxoadipate enol-lactonase